MSTDPHALPGADPHTGSREIDPVTGYDTTGHDWGGIRELNTPFPRIAGIFMALTFAYSVVAWILLPAWPYGRNFTPGVLGLDQGTVALAAQQTLAERRSNWLTPFEVPDFSELSADKVLMAQAIPAAHRLFVDNCAACHGIAGGGGPGFPVLNDANWLWSGTPEEIAISIRHGINAADEDTRQAEMPAFDWIESPERLALAQYVAALPEEGADPESSSAALFSENCVACHGEDASGGLELGAPSLTDDAVLYGQDPQSVYQTLTHGRRGTMPAWADRLNEAEINLIALYVAQMSTQPVKDVAP